MYKKSIIRSDVKCEKLFLLSYSTGRTVIYDAERNLLAIAKFLAKELNGLNGLKLHHFTTNVFKNPGQPRTHCRMCMRIPFPSSGALVAVIW